MDPNYCWDTRTSKAVPRKFTQALAGKRSLQVSNHRNAGIRRKFYRVAPSDLRVDHRKFSRERRWITLDHAGSRRLVRIGARRRIRPNSPRAMRQGGGTSAFARLVSIARFARREQRLSFLQFASNKGNKARWKASARARARGGSLTLFLRELPHCAIVSFLSSIAAGIGLICVIRGNCICPGNILSEFYGKSLSFSRNRRDHGTESRTMLPFLRYTHARSPIAPLQCAPRACRSPSAA